MKNAVMETIFGSVGKSLITKTSFLVVAFTTITCMGVSALTVGRLTVNDLMNPNGVDDIPCLGWTLESDQRGTKQQSYEISLYSDDKYREQLWSTGIVVSDQSQDVRLDGVTLSPETRYYWTVTVKDNYNNKATSTEKAYFDTGVMGDWGPAKWIRVGAYTSGYFVYRNLNEYTIDYDVKITQSTAGVCLFRSRDLLSHKIWQFDIKDTKTPGLNIYNWSNDKYKLLTAIKLADYNLQIQPNEWFHVKLHISNAHKCATYVNNVLVDERTGYYPDSQLGICQNIEKSNIGVACFDNFRVENLASDVVLLDENFEGTNVFGNGDIDNGTLIVDGNRYGTLWQPIGKADYSIAADITVLNGGIGIYFDATEIRNALLWTIDTDKGNTPILRRLASNWGSPVQIGDEVPINILTKNDFLNHKHHVKIHIEGTTNYIYTYLDEKLVDICTDAPRTVAINKLGFNVKKGNQAYIDNVRSEIYYPDGKSSTILSDDFENPESLNFNDAEIISVNNNRVWDLNAVNEDVSVLQFKSETPIFYKNFAINKDVKSAKLYTTALGCYDLWVNGVRVGHEQPDGTMEYEELKPGWVDYRTRLIYSTHDVTKLCKKGSNIIGALVTPGWYHGSIARNTYSTSPGLYALGFLGKLVITFADDTQAVVGTDEGWSVSEFGPLRYGEIYEGEYYDARYGYPWDSAGGILPFIAQSYDYKHAIESSQSTYVKALTPIPPVSVTVYDNALAGQDYGEINVVKYIERNDKFTLKKGQTAVIDFGQNNAGVPKFSVKGVSGTRLQMRFAEIVNESGLKDRNNDGPKGSIYRRNMVKENTARLYYVLAGKTSGESYQPTSTYYGYRYCEITATDDIEITEFAAVPLTSSHEQIGYISTDNQDVNKLISNILWSQRSDMLSTPLDCPSRTERLGWTGDIRGFTVTAMYNANVSAFLRNWLADLRSTQRSDGAISDVVPSCLPHYGNAGWADAGITMPWSIYMMTGNIDVVKENYNVMTRYMDYLSTLSEEGLKYPGPGTLYGDWVAIEETDKRYVSQAFYAYDAYLMSKMSKLLSKDYGDDYAKASIRYEELFNSIRNEMLDIYFDDNGLLNPTQTACVLALYFNICDDDRRDKVASMLVSLIEGNGYRLSTGFIGTVHICQVLCDNGRADLAYNLLLQRNYPSWLYSVSQGATTIWEYWYTYNDKTGIHPLSLNSFNHLAFGSVGEWMFSNMAGIKACEDFPGFKKILFEPDFYQCHPNSPDKDNIMQVNASYDSKFGKIKVDWHFDDENQPVYHIIVPANTEGVLRFPVASEETIVYESGKDASISDFVTYLGFDSGYKFYNICSGEYRFSLNETSGEDGDIDIEKSEIKVYPNPVSDMLYISSDDQIKEIRLYNSSGLLIETIPGNCNQVDCGLLSPGIYILNILKDDNVFATKIIKQ